MQRYRNKKKKNKKSYMNNNRYRRRSYLNAVPYSIKAGPQRYGPGKNLSVINERYGLPDNDVSRISLQTILLTNTEFSTKKIFFRYFKILEIRAVFTPNNVVGNPRNHYLNLSWNSIEEVPSDIEKDDSTKMVPYFRTRTRVVKWRPIRSVINVNSILQEVPVNFMDLSEFISTDRVVSLPGWLYVSNGGGSADQFMLEIVIEFRGNDYGNAPAKVHELETLIEKFKNMKVKEVKIYDLLPVSQINEEEEDEKEEEDKFKNFKKNKLKK